MVHPASKEAMMSELDLWVVPMTSKQVVRGKYVYYQPLAPLESGSVIEFVIPGTGEDYIELNRTVLEITGKFVGPSNVDLSDTDLYAPVNNFMHSLFRQIDVTLNDHQVARSSQTYPYKAYIEKLINFSNATKETNLTSAVWYSDTDNKFNTLADDNVGYKKRSALAKSSKVFEMADKIHLDIFNVKKALLNNVTLKVKLIRSPPEFYTMRPDKIPATGSATSPTDSKAITFQITKAELKIRKIKLTDRMIAAHGICLEDANAKYPINNVEIKQFTIMANSQGQNIDNIFLGSIPIRIFIAMVDVDALEGSYRLNPFEFKHNSVNFLSLYIDGVQVPSRAYQPDFDNNLYLPCFLDMLEAAGIWNTGKTNGFSRSNYAHGNTIFGFDLTPMMTAATDSFHLITQGSMRLEIKFAKALTKNINLLIYGENDHIMQADTGRRIALDFAT